MNGNFDPEQNLKDNDQTVHATGWLAWDADDKSAEITVTIEQDGYPCAGPQFTCTRNATSPGTRVPWGVDVHKPSPPPWKRGGASGTADAVVTRQDNSTYPAPWNAPSIKLK